MTISSIKSSRAERVSAREKEKKEEAVAAEKALGGREGDVRGRGAETKREGIDGGSKEGGRKGKIGHSM